MPIRIAGCRAVGLIPEPQQAEAILQDGHADLIALARELLRNPKLARARGEGTRHRHPPQPVANMLFMVLEATR